MRLLPILAIVAAIMAALTALVFFSAAIVLPALVAVVSGVFLVLTRSRPGLAMGGAAIILGILGVLGSLGSIGTEDGSLDFGIQESLAASITIAALLAIPGALVWMHWDRFDRALAIGAAMDLVLAAVLALLFQESLGDQTMWEAFVVALLAAAGVLPGILAMRLHD